MRKRKKRNIFREGSRRGEGGGETNWSLGLGEIPGLPPFLNETRVCVWTQLFWGGGGLVGCGGFCLDILEYFKVLYLGSANLPYSRYHYKS